MEDKEEEAPPENGNCSFKNRFKKERAECSGVDRCGFKRKYVA